METYGFGKQDCDSVINDFCFLLRLSNRLIYDYYLGLTMKKSVFTIKEIKNVPLLGAFLRYLRKRCRFILRRLKWYQIEKEFQRYLSGQEQGVLDVKRETKVIVSLTSYPPRIPRIHYTIFSLLKQTVKPDEIILWLAEEQFPNRNEDLPDSLLELCKHGLTIKYCHDMKSYKKLIPTLKEYPDDIIVTVDDDVWYVNDMLELLLSSYEKDKKSVHGHCGHVIAFEENDQPANYLDWKRRVAFHETKPSFRNFLTGVGGILYPPNVFHQDILREDLFMQLSPNADDIWFWAMTVLNDVKICVVENNISHLIANLASQDSIRGEFSRLMAVNWWEGGNDKQIRQVLEYYPVILAKLKAEKLSCNPT